MKILLSPAKMLDETTPFPNIEYTNPMFKKQTDELVKSVKKWKPSDFSKYMGISEKLAALNYERFQNWVSPEEKSDARRPAIFTFNGECYHGLDIHSLEKKHYAKLQENLRILSGLYGMLLPFDWMYPYRLEMGTKADFSKKKSLYEFWGETLINQLNQEEDKIIFNLASKEYFTAAKLAKAKAKVITPTFKEDKNGTLKTVMMYAKNQRGKFARFLIENPNWKIEEYKVYDQDGYLFNKALSSENEWVFVR